MRVIRASEIGDYVFCRRAWWLKHVRGLRSANVRELAEGTAAHAAHGQRVKMAAALRVAALILFLAALLFFALSLFPPN
jgi:hypothetical protein